MGFRSWLRTLMGRRAGRRGDAGRSDPGRQEPSRPAEPLLAPGCPRKDWDPVPAYLPVDPQEHRTALVIAAALAAGAATDCRLAVRRVSVINPEYERVAVIASALAAGSLDRCALRVKRIYRRKTEVADAA